MHTIAWLSLTVAGLFEILWVIGMKASDGFSKPWPTVFTLICMAVSFGLLSYSLKQIPLGTAYAVWVGIGAVGVALVGIFWLKEPATAARISCIALIVGGVIGLNWSALANSITRANE